MSSRDSIQTRQLLAKGLVINVGTDTPVAIRIFYTGSGSPTSVTITAATNIVLVDSAATDTVAFATYATIGAVANQINNGTAGRWQAVVLDALRSQASASTLVDGAITAGSDELGTTCWDAPIDTSVYKSFVVALSPFRNFGAPKGHRVHLLETTYTITLGGAGAGLVRVYKRVNGVETELLRELSVSATKTTISFASGQGKISSDTDGEILVRVLDATSITDAAGNFLRAVGLYE